MNIFKLTRRFRKIEDGSLTVEAVLIVPILVWAITATFVFWDAFKTMTVSQKATYTVADMLSRETSAVDGNYMTAAHELYGYLANSTNNSLRVSVVTMNEDPDTLERTMELVWSEGVGGMEGYTAIEPLKNRVPDMAPGDQLIVVESVQSWSPGFAVGLAEYNFREVAIMRPRFAPQLVWGDGSGDAGGGGTAGILTETSG
jgi:hypothetical protein